MVLSAQLIVGALIGAAITWFLRKRFDAPSKAETSATIEILEEHELLTKNIAAAVIIRDLRKGITFCSPYTEVLTGYSPDEITNVHEDFFERIVIDEDRERYRRALKVSELGEDYLVRFRIKHKSGIKLWLESRLVPVMDQDGNVTTIMGVTIDVTDTLNSQRKIEQQNRDLSDFSYMVSHDLKSPIFTIKGMATALTEDYGPSLNEDARQQIKFILEGAGRLEKLVASILQYSLISTAEHEELDVSLELVVNNVVSDLSEQIRAKQATIEISPNLPHICGHEVQLYQLFSNLIGNALKYSARNRAPQISVNAIARGLDTATIEVKDNGCGIPANKLADIFRPFHRAHGAEIEGTGIGLACVKKIVERHGGRISVQSEPDKGSSFIVELPLAVHNEKAEPEDLVRCFERV